MSNSVHTHTLRCTLWSASFWMNNLALRSDHRGAHDRLSAFVCFCAHTSLFLCISTLIQLIRRSLLCMCLWCIVSLLFQTIFFYTQSVFYFLIFIILKNRYRPLACRKENKNCLKCKCQYGSRKRGIVQLEWCSLSSSCSWLFSTFSCRPHDLLSLQICPQTLSLLQPGRTGTVLSVSKRRSIQ